jgi:hypothetical protein
MTINSTLAVEVHDTQPPEIWVVGDEGAIAFDYEFRVQVSPAQVMALRDALAEAAGFAAALVCGECCLDKPPYKASFPVAEALEVEVRGGDPPEVCVLRNDGDARVLVWPAEIVALRDALAEAAGVAAAVAVQ